MEESEFFLRVVSRTDAERGANAEKRLTRYNLARDTQMKQIYQSETAAEERPRGDKARCRGCEAVK